MAYTSFTNRSLKEKFGIVPDFRDDLFKSVTPRPVSDWLLEAIHRNKRMALLQTLEKPRSEFLIAPVITEFYTQAEQQISVFSGLEFNVDVSLGLFGRADFLISRSSNQADLETPVVVGIEAKRQDFDAGATQCIAEMIAARIFNERENNPIKTIYGCVTTGDAWRFLLLRDAQALIETTIYDLSEDLERIIGILWAMSFDEIDF